MHHSTKFNCPFSKMSKKIHRVCHVAAAILMISKDLHQPQLYFYSPKAYQYVRSIFPLPNPSLIRKWTSSVDCEPGLLKEAFKALSDEVKQCPDKKDCCLIVDAMSIRKETVWDKKNDRYDGFINYGTVNPDDPETLASEALVFLLVEARTHW